MTLKLGVVAMLMAASVFTVAVPEQAAANDKVGAAIAGGIIGGIIGGAIANQRPAYGAPVYVQPRPVYVQPQPVYVQPRCTWQNVRVSDGYGGWFWQRQQVCG